MRAQCNQGRFFAAAVSALALLAAAPAPAPAGDKGDPRAALRLRCDEALASATRTSFGWGWTYTDAAAPEEPAKDAKKGAARRQKAPDPLIDAVPTAVIGVQLLWAGESLGDDRYRQAAREAGRGLAAIQNPTGQVRARGLLGKAGGPKEPLSEVPDRAPTRAALGLWLALLEADAGGGGRAPAQRPPAAAAAHWLARQQTPAGAWAVLHPPDAPRGKGARIVRIDDPDFRDTALALLLAGEVLKDAHLRTVFDRSVDALLACRVASGVVAQPALWQAAYSLDGMPQQKFSDLPQGTDLLASRRAMEVLLCGHLLGSNPKAAPALSEAAAALSALPRRGDAWSRHYDRRGRPIAVTATTREAGFFQTPVGGDAQTPLAVAPVLGAADQIRRGGEDALLQSLERGFPLRRGVVAIICGASGQLLGEGEGELGHASLQSERVRALWLAVRKVPAAGKS